MSHHSERTAPPTYQSSSPGQFSHNPATHPDSAFSRLQGDRQQQNRDQTQVNEGEAEYDQLSPVSSLSTSPAPPPHIQTHDRHWPQEPGYRNSDRTSYSVTTPGADNFGEQAAGGIAGIALGVASANERESGIEAMRNIHGPSKIPQPFSETWWLPVHWPEVPSSFDYLRAYLYNDLLFCGC